MPSANNDSNDARSEQGALPDFSHSAQSDYLALSSFARLRDLEPPRSGSGKPSISFLHSNTHESPKPWQRLPWHRRFVLVPYLWLLVWVDYARRMLLGLRWMVRQWIRQRPGVLVQAAETLAWPLVFVLLCHYANPSNPFYVDSGFPWPWLGVWLIALRYGSFSAACASLVLLAAWYLSSASASIPRLYFLGGTIMALIAGEFGSLWMSRTAKQTQVTRYFDEKTDRLTRRLYLLKLSHDELEYEMIERPSTLRDALANLQSQLARLSVDRDKLPSAQVMMDFLAAHTQIESGAFFEWIDGPHPKLQRAAKVGTGFELAAHEPMVERAIESGQSIHLLDQFTESASGNAVLLVCPLFDSERNPIGLLAVHRLPFVAFNAENLRNIDVLTDAYAEFVRLRRFAGPLMRAWPNAPISLTHEYAWLHRIRTTHGIDSGCLLWRAQGSQADALLSAVRYAYDHSSLAWRLGRGNAQFVLALVPFVTQRRLSSHQQLVLEMVERRVGVAQVATMLSCKHLDLGDDDNWTGIRDRANQAAS